METRARYIWVGVFALAAILAGFGFVYWLNNSGGLAKRAVYQVRFQGPVSGLQIGAAVQFNGIRVGEVTGLRLDASNPGQVMAAIAVDGSTPLRADTKVGVDFQGLMGTPAISLRGGASTSPLLTGSEANPGRLVADAAAGQDLTQTARQALQQVDKILSDNSEPLKSTIDNLKTFSAALARNSDRIDGVLAGLEHLAGGGPPEKPKPLYDLTAPSTFPSPSTAQRRVQFVISEVTAILAFDTQRMLTCSKDGEILQLGDAQWSDTLPKLIQEKLIQSFENAGFETTVAARGEQVTANYQLLIDLRSFAITTGSESAADIEFSAKIVGDNGRIVNARLFHATAPTKGTDAAMIAAAFNHAFGKVATDLVNWTSGAI